MSEAPSQNEIDRVAVYVEAARELQREPFFGKDENRKVSFQGPNFTYVLGDRFHFRSALVTFRRIWMTKEPSHFYGCYKVLERYSDEHEKGLLKSWRESVRQIEDSPVGILGVGQITPTVTHRHLIDLWLNAVFAHVSIKPGDNKRKEFEELLAKYGQAPIEHAFRVAIMHLGSQYQNMSNIHAEHFLKHWKEAKKLEPSFCIGAPFGIKKREVTAEGHTIIRVASTKYYSSESVEAMIQRICERNHNSSIKFLASHLEFPFAEVAKRLLLAENIDHLMTTLGIELKIAADVNMHGSFPGEGPRSFMGLHDPKNGQTSGLLIQGQSATTTSTGKVMLDNALALLQKEFREELEDDV